MKKKKIVLFFSALGVLVSLWYLFFKTYDYQIVIHTQTSQGTCFQSILDWNETLRKKRDIPVSIYINEPFNTISQSLTLESNRLDLDWNIKKKNDSTATIFLGIKNKTNSVKDRIEKLFGRSKLKPLINDEVTNFNTVLLRHLKAFKVKVNGISKSPDAYVAYVNIKSTQKEKAGKMIANSPYINSFLEENGIELQSHPFLEIKTWDPKSTQLDFNFCFPIRKTDSFPEHKDIKYKKVVGKPALKAIFNGNYSISDRAWYALLHYGEAHDIKLKSSLIEVFYNNPHLGEDEMGWEAVVYFGTW